MFNIYLIDYHNPLFCNGLSTYVTQLSQKLTQIQTIKLHIIWVNSFGYKEIITEHKENTEHIFVPFDVAVNGFISKNDEILSEYLFEKTKNQEDVLFHFNWINHGVFSSLLKRKIAHCKTILTKHCVPWRDFITSDYPLFFKVHTAFEQNQKLSFMLKNKLSNEISSYKSFDHIISVTKDAKNVLNQLFEIPQEKITTIYNGIDLEGFNTKK